MGCALVKILEIILNEHQISINKTTESETIKIQAQNILKFAVRKTEVKFCTFVVRKKRFNRLTGVNSPGR
jgi:hypothetical protein